MLAVIHRDLKGTGCCQGTLVVAALTLQTLELPWIPAPPGRGGHKDESCVPEGLYTLVRHSSVAHPRSFALVNPDLDVFHNPADVPADRVPYARTEVLLHIANYPHELLGCIGLGMERGTECVLDSRTALERFNLVVPWMEGHTLRIESADTAAP